MMVTTTTTNPRSPSRADRSDPGAPPCCGGAATALAAELARAMVPADAVPSRWSATAEWTTSPLRRDGDVAGRRPADLVVVGSIASGAGPVPGAVPGALAVRDGLIVAVGQRHEIEALTGPDTEVFHAGDRVVVPGFVEPHMHLWSTALIDPWLDCSALVNPTFDLVVERLATAAAQVAPGAWVLGKQFDPSLFPGEPDLTADLLDRIAPGIPVVVFNASMHFLYVSSTAFERAGITAATPDPPSGRFYRAGGRLTGVVGEPGAMMAVLKAMPPGEPTALVDGLRAVMERAASRGVTSIREALTGAVLGTAELGVLHSLNDAARLPVRVSTAQTATLGHEKWAAAGVTPGSGTDMVRATAWKIISDGSNQGRSGFQRQPYLGTDHDCGHPNVDVDGLTDAIREGHRAGWQVMVHANGDAAIDLTLDAYERALEGSSGLDLRHRIEHCSIAHPEQFARMARLGVSPSFLMNHVYYWGRVLRDSIIGPARAAKLDRVAMAVAHDLRVSLHSDYSVSPVDPLSAARTAVRREMHDGGEVLGPDERVGADVALRAITADAAWQVHHDAGGVLQVGRVADFAVLSADPWSTDPSVWPEIVVSETRIGGEIAWLDGAV